jgi:hypothetical protein
MKRQCSYLAFLFFTLLMMACAEKVEVDIPESYDKAAITGASVYRAAKEGDKAYSDGLAFTNITATVTLSEEEDANRCTIALATTEDLTQLKVLLTISSAATVIAPLGTAIQDYSVPKTVKIASPSGKVVKEWSIKIENPSLGTTLY